MVFSPSDTIKNFTYSDLYAVSLNESRYSGYLDPDTTLESSSQCSLVGDAYSFSLLFARAGGRKYFGKLHIGSSPASACSCPHRRHIGGKFEPVGCLRQ
jgi:hypothetical protein